MDIRSNCTLGLEVFKVDGNTSFSKKPMNFLSIGCKGSKSVALLCMKRIKNENKMQKKELQLKLKHKAFPKCTVF